MNDPIQKEVEAELERMLTGTKPKVITARLTSLPIPAHIDAHLRGKNIKYLWNLAPIKNSPVAGDNGMYLGLWMNGELDYIHLIIATKEVVEYYANIPTEK